MKNGCVLLKNGIDDGVEANALLRVFRTNGYDFDEQRTLFRLDESLFVHCIRSLQESYENIAIFAERSCLLHAKKLLSALIGEENFQGTASGLGVFIYNQKMLFLLSADRTGEEYAREVCIPYLQKKYCAKMERTTIRTVGANPEHIKNLIASAKTLDEGKMQYLRTRKYDEEVIEIIYDENVSKRIADSVLRVFAEGLSDSIYALDNTAIEEQLVRLLKLRGRKLSVAESFTGGGVAKRIVSVSGASEVYFEGINAYDEFSKQKRLGVSAYTLKTVGAVSDQTAYEMASGLIATGDCDISIATTGLAGPKSDRSALPVGLCYIAVGTKERVFVYRYQFDGTRTEIAETAINYALFLAYKHLKNL